MRIAILTTDSREHYRDYSSQVPAFGTAPEALLTGLAKLPGVEVHVVSCLREPVQSPEKLADNIWYHPIHVPKWGWMRTAYLGCITATRSKLVEIQPNVVHGQGTERDCAISAVYSGFPNVVTVHGNMRVMAELRKARPFSYCWLNGHLETFTLRRTRGVVCITSYTQEAVGDLVRCTWIVPNAVDDRFFLVERQAESTPVILCVGVISHRKNQIALIRALDSIAGQIPFRVIFLGAAEAGSYCDEFQVLLKSRPWCEHHGLVGREALKDWFSRASLSVLPSLEDNCPMAVLESMASGVPVVAAKVGGVPDLIEDRVNGLFCDPLNIETIKSAVIELLSNGEFANNLAIEARKRAIEAYHPKVVAQRHLEIYREIL